MIIRRIEGRARDLGGGFKVRRVLPSPQQRLVGPFIFWDHFGPASYAPGERFDVRPHPHINLATVTYLFEGEIFHRDSLGSAQAIRPGAVNWMTAGRGITHSERTSPEVEASGQRMEGIQAWVALPKTHEEMEPSFVHHPADTLPVIEQADGAQLTIVAGTAYGMRAPVDVVWPTLYVDAHAKAGARVEVPREHEERALYVASGSIAMVGGEPGQAQTAAAAAGVGETAEEGEMLILEPGVAAAWTATTDARVLMLGGKAIDGPRTIWWNFVSSRPDRINEAADAWAADDFPNVPGDDAERIPLPDDPRPKG